MAVEPPPPGTEEDIKRYSGSSKQETTDKDAKADEKATDENKAAAANGDAKKNGSGRGDKDKRGKAIPWQSWSLAATRPGSVYKYYSPPLLDSFDALYP